LYGRIVFTHGSHKLLVWYGIRAALVANDLALRSANEKKPRTRNYRSQHIDSSLV
jgi:hypothetical protein